MAQNSRCGARPETRNVIARPLNVHNKPVQLSKVVVNSERASSDDCPLIMFVLMEERSSSNLRQGDAACIQES